MLPSGPAFWSRAALPVRAVASFTRSPRLGEKSMGIKLEEGNHSAEFFMVSVRIIRVGTGGASAAMAETVEAVSQVEHMVETARRAIVARPVVRTLGLVRSIDEVLWLPRIAAIARLCMSRAEADNNNNLSGMRK